MISEHGPKPAQYDIRHIYRWREYELKKERKKINFDKNDNFDIDILDLLL